MSPKTPRTRDLAFRSPRLFQGVCRCDKTRRFLRFRLVLGALLASGRGLGILSGWLSDDFSHDLGVDVVYDDHVSTARGAVNEAADADRELPAALAALLGANAGLGQIMDSIAAAAMRAERTLGPEDSLNKA